MINIDIEKLNDALGLEQFAVATYDKASMTGLLTNSEISLAKTFKIHHVEHAGKLRETIISLGGEPIKPLTSEQYLKKIISEKFSDQESIIRYALKLEKSAAIAYLNAIPEFENRKIVQAAASILGDEAMRWATLRKALGLAPVHISFILLTEDEVED